MIDQIIIFSENFFFLIVNSQISLDELLRNLTKENEGDISTSPELMELRNRFDFNMRTKHSDNVFFKLLYHRETKKSSMNHTIDFLSPKRGNLFVKTTTSGSVNVYHKTYKLDEQEVMKFMEYYNIPLISVVNIQQEAGHAPVNWSAYNTITLHHETTGLTPVDWTEGVFSVMWGRENEETLKETFELEAFPFDFQVRT